MTPRSIRCSASQTIERYSIFGTLVRAGQLGKPNDSACGSVSAAFPTMPITGYPCVNCGSDLFDVNVDCPPDPIKITKKYLWPVPPEPEKQRVLAECMDVCRQCGSRRRRTHYGVDAEHHEVLLEQIWEVH